MCSPPKDYLAKTLDAADLDEATAALASIARADASFQRFLRGLVLVPGPDLGVPRARPPPPPPPPSMAQVVQAALLDLLAAAPPGLAKNNVLSAGFYLRPGPGGALEARQRQPNLAVTELQRNAQWARLLQTLGPAALHRLLVECSVFHPFDDEGAGGGQPGPRRVRGANHVQLSGRRVDAVAWEVRGRERTGLGQDTAQPRE